MLTGSDNYTLWSRAVKLGLLGRNNLTFCYAEFEIIRENINAKIKTTDLRGSPINWLRPREEGEQFYYGEARTEYRIGFVIASIYSGKLRSNRIGPKIHN